MYKAISISAKLGRALGFENVQIYQRKIDGVVNLKMEPLQISADFVPPNFKTIFQTLYVYCNLVEDQIVGNSLVPLLRILDVEGSHGEVVCKTYDSPHYVPVLVKDILSIEINIKNDMNDFLFFKFGKVIVKLHLRKRSLY